MKNKKKLILFGILLFTTILYLPGIFHTWVNYDEPRMIMDNKYIQEINIKNLTEILTGDPLPGRFMPVTYLSYLINYVISGPSYKAFYLTALAILLIILVLFYELIIRLFNNEKLALLSTSIIAVHPFFVELVCWVSCRAHLLAIMFFLLTLIYFFKFIENLDKTKWGFYALSIIFYLLTLLSKDFYLTLPIFLCIIILFKYKEKRLTRLLYTAPFILINVFFLNFTLKLADKNLRIVSEYFGGSVYSTILSNFRIFVAYLFNQIIPIWITPQPFVQPSVSFTQNIGPNNIPTLDISTITAIIILALFILAGILLRKRQPLFIIYVIVFFTALIPAANFPPRFIVMADRYVMLPLMALSLLISDTAIKAWKKLGRKAYFVIIPFIIWFGFITIRTPLQIKVWANTKNLWKHHLRIFPQDPAGHYYMGKYYLKKRNYQKALSEFQLTAQYDPDYYRVWYRIGEIYYQLDEPEKALKSYQKSLEVGHPLSARGYRHMKKLFNDKINSNQTNQPGLDNTILDESE